MMWIWSYYILSLFQREGKETCYLQKSACHAFFDTSLGDGGQARGPSNYELGKYCSQIMFNIQKAFRDYSSPLPGMVCGNTAGNRQEGEGWQKWWRCHSDQHCACRRWCERDPSINQTEVTIAVVASSSWAGNSISFISQKQWCIKMHPAFLTAYILLILFHWIHIFQGHFLTHVAVNSYSSIIIWNLLLLRINQQWKMVGFSSAGL